MDTSDKGVQYSKMSTERRESGNNPNLISHQGAELNESRKMWSVVTCAGFSN